MPVFRITLKLPSQSVWRTSRSARAFCATVKPSTIWRTLSYLQAPHRDVYLLGTAHISETSAKEVRRLARSVKPEIIFVELCEKRARRLRGDAPEEERENISKLAANIFAGKLSVADAVFKMVTQSLQARSAGTVGLQPGAELLAGLEAGDELGAQIVLGDRNVDETTKRLRVAVWEELSAVMSIRPGPEVRAALQGGGGLSATVDRLRARDVLSDIRRTLEEQAPKTAAVLMHERDEIMASQIIELSATGKRVLAVVGAAHMHGIEERWLKHFDN